jgi:hypothetical protein
MSTVGCSLVVVLWDKAWSGAGGRFAEDSRLGSPPARTLSGMKVIIIIDRFWCEGYDLSRAMRIISTRLLDKG